MIPPPSKRGFAYPVSTGDLAYFCHPSLELFAAPVMAENGGERGDVLVASGYVALRLWKWSGEPPERAAGAEYRRRFENLPWGRFAHAGQHGEWRLITDAPIYRYGIFPLWHGPRTFTMDRLVCVAGAPLIPLALLQLIGRLPKAEMCVSGSLLGQPILFRFAGGMGIIPGMNGDLTKLPAPVATFLSPRPAPGRI